MRRAALTLFIISALFLVGQAQLQAQMTYSTSDPLGDANTFNAFIFNEATLAGGHSDGGVFVGTTFTMAYNTDNGGATGTIGSTSNIGIYTNSLVVTGSAQVNSNANVYTNSITGQSNLDLNGGSLHSVTTAAVNSVTASQLAYSQYQSSHLGALTGTTFYTNSNNWTINAGASTLYGNLKVFTISGSNLSTGSTGQTLNVSGLMSNQTLVINVTGAAPGINLNVNGVSGNQLIWNFLTVSSPSGNTYTNPVTIDGDLVGTVLAPNADVIQSQSGNIDGILIASHWSDSGAPEVHYTSSTTFADPNGNLRPYSPLVAAPEPGTVGLLIGLGLSTGIAVRRRRKK